ncbi:MAG: hypothetical protein QM674_20770 [Burkholderiaceae bacterium]
MRSPSKPMATGLGALLQSAGFTRAQDDSYTVQDYLLSRDAVRDIDKEFDLRAAFGGGEIDRLSRFAGLWWDDSFEALYRYYRNQIAEVTLDPQSSIITLTVRAFSADEASRINESLLRQSEALVNRLNERGRRDLVAFAQADVERAQAKARTAIAAVADYRREHAIFDPERQSAIQLQFVAKLQEELIASRAQLAQVRALTTDSAQLAMLSRRVQSLVQDIGRESRNVAGGDVSLAAKSTEYERLSLEREFADRQVAAAMASLEQAHTDALRKQLYLERLVQPNMPDIAIEPRRIRAVLSTLALGLIAFGILSLLLAGVREHRD